MERANRACALKSIARVTPLLWICMKKGRLKGKRDKLRVGGGGFSWDEGMGFEDNPGTSHPFGYPVGTCLCLKRVNDR